MAKEPQHVNGTKRLSLGIKAVLALVGMLLCSAIALAAMGKDGLAESLIKILGALSLVGGV